MDLEKLNEDQKQTLETLEAIQLELGEVKKGVEVWTPLLATDFQA